MFGGNIFAAEISINIRRKTGFSVSLKIPFSSDSPPNVRKGRRLYSGTNFRSPVHLGCFFHR